MPILTWWDNLEVQWRNALGITFFHHLQTPTIGELQQLLEIPVLRFAGPTAPYPNMSFELTNLSGIEQLSNLEILVATHHQLKHIRPVQSMKKLKSLFLFNNQIESLEGIEDLVNLEQLYVQFNKISSLEPLKKLTNLKEVYINNNLISSLHDLTEEHSAKLTNFYCTPNELLPQKEIIYMENQVGIKCKGV